MAARNCQDPPHPSELHTFMPIGHLLAAREVEAHEGTEAEEEGEIKHKQDILHVGMVLALLACAGWTGHPQLLSNPRKKHSSQLPEYCQQQKLEDRDAPRVSPW